MKKIFFIGVLLHMAISGRLNAQVKPQVKTQPKTDVKKPAATPVVKTPAVNKIDFFRTNADDAVQILSDELKKLKIVLTGLEDNPLYSFHPITNEKVPGDTESEKILYFGNNLNARIKASTSNIVYRLSFSTTNAKCYTAIKALLAFDTRSKIAEGYNDTTFRDGAVFANLNSTEGMENDKPITYYAITAERTRRSSTILYDSVPVFNIDSLDIHTHKFDATYDALNFVKKLGYSFHYITNDSHFVDEKSGKRYGTEFTAYFNKNVSVDFELNKLWLVNRIAFRSPDPIAFNKLKKAFNLSNWKMNGTVPDGNITFYGNKNVTCQIQNDAHQIVFTIKPASNDIDTRFALAPTPILSELIALRYSGSEKITAARIKASYLTKIKYDDKAKRYVVDETASDFIFYYPSPTGKLVKVLFEMVLTPKWTAPFLVDSDDQDYLKSLAAEFDNSASYKGHYSKILLNGQFRIHSNDWEDTRERNEAAKKETDRLAELEKERKKAENAAKVNEAIINATENLKRMLQKP